MKNILSTLLILTASLITQTHAAAKPNILLIYSDDHGWADLGIQGVDKDIRTPNLDQLARDGVLFKRGYVTAPQCVPSRAGVITGRYQQRFGVEDNNHGPLPLEEVTIAERLKTAGYLSGWVGKSHLDIAGKGEGKGEKANCLLTDHMPQHQGFEEYFRGELRQFYASHDLKGQRFADAPHLVTDSRFRVVVQTEAALSFLERRTATPEQPWFLYLAWYAPHVPLESPEPWFSKTSLDLPLKRRQALAMIAGMDDGLGRIRAKLKEMGQEKNTLIFFIGDNGAPLGPVWDGSLNLPMIGQKGMVAEGGVRVPFVAAWPGHLPAGATYEQPVISLDVAATAAAVAGLPKDERLDGVNLVPFVSGENSGAPHENLFWRWASQSSVLEMPYKLVKLGARPALLFDVTTPDGENYQRDLAKEHPDVVARLEKKLNAWAAGLKPPGLSTEDSSFTRHHEELFAEHHIIEPSAAAAHSAATADADGAIQGWLVRNGSIAVKDGALVVTPAPDAAANARPFVANAHLDLSGPVTATLHVRCKSAGNGKATISWRTKQKSFADDQVAGFDWPSGDVFQPVHIALGEQARIIHVRINPPRGASGVEFESMEFKDSQGKVQAFRFGGE